jgi:hypothetical protein
MKINDMIMRISLGLLLGIGTQFFIYGMFTFRPLDFNSFSLVQWVFQIIYVTFIVTVAIGTNKK